MAPNNHYKVPLGYSKSIIPRELICGSDRVANTEDCRAKRQILPILAWGSTWDRPRTEIGEGGVAVPVSLR